jgi:hypothetical protein
VLLRGIFKVSIGRCVLHLLLVLLLKKLTEIVCDFFNWYNFYDLFGALIKRYFHFNRILLKHLMRFMPL